MNVCIRTDASDLIGTGHVMRCLTLAGRLHRAGAKIAFICRELPGSIHHLVEEAGVDVFTIGQYLQPTKEHHPVVRFYHPDEFRELGRIGLEMGFRHVESGPLVRSSYRAASQIPSPAG